MPIMCLKIKPIYIITIILLVAGIVVFASGEKPPEGTPVPVLMYHQVSNKPSKLGEYVVSAAELENDIKVILDKGFTPMFASELLSCCQNKTPLPEKPILLTFDDNYMSDYVYVLPLLKKYNIKANFAVVGALADLYSSGIDRHVDYAQCTWDEIREMKDTGLCEFLSHSYDMHNFSKRKGVLRTYAESHENFLEILEDDIEKNKETFEKNLGCEPTAFVYPFGSYNDEVGKIINSHFKMSFGVYEKPNYIKGNEETLYLLHRYNMVHNRNIEKVLSD